MYDQGQLGVDNVFWSSIRGAAKSVGLKVVNIGLNRYNWMDSDNEIC